MSEKRANPRYTGYEHPHTGVAQGDTSQPNTWVPVTPPSPFEVMLPNGDRHPLGEKE